MKFKDFLKESKKVSGVKNTLGKWDSFNGTLDVTISPEFDVDNVDELTNYAKIIFSGRSWELMSLSISDEYSQSTWKKEVKSAIDKMLSKSYPKYFDETEDDVWVVDYNSDFIIELSKSTLK